MHFYQKPEGMTISDIIECLEHLAPPMLQESYDNAGLICGSPEMEIDSALLSIDVTEEVVDEALEKGNGLIIAHHPLVFSPLKKLTGRDHVERTLIRAVRGGLGIYAAHTNLDSVRNGVNGRICSKLGLSGIRVLSPRADNLRKLVFFVPADHAEKVRDAVFEAGAGHIGQYDLCSFNAEGKGTFRASGTADPFVGEKGKLHSGPEIRVETIFRAPDLQRVIAALLGAHPYEEVAYDVYSLLNTDPATGIGMTGVLEQPVPEGKFLDLLKKVFSVPVIRHSPMLGRQVKKVAVCGGSGSFLIRDAIKSGSDAFVTADIKYHQFFDADGRIMLADIGHFESERYTTEIIYESVSEKFPNFALHFSEVKTNPINYH